MVAVLSFAPCLERVIPLAANELPDQVVQADGKGRNIPFPDRVAQIRGEKAIARFSHSLHQCIVSALLVERNKTWTYEKGLQGVRKQAWFARLRLCSPRLLSVQDGSLGCRGLADGEDFAGRHVGAGLGSALHS